MKTNNKTHNTKYPIRFINGVRAYLIAGCWYCDYNNYYQTKQQQGIRTNEDVFLSFCNKYDLQPTG